ncbi:hypothetical protein Apa02nite_098590 [Actinoplanes palleronii]|uniref:Uncharacterized protein n=1 Tax=Actinoplanes palleronii TaxID=113570 RepID=A0ABQ4BTY0_9ACTN|nr:hypothetical protein Apa02nite_098590 [Actinoplanes palleronii]
MGAQTEWERSPGGCLERRDTMVTSALIVGSGLADDPYRSDAVVARWDVSELEPNPGRWPTTAARDRPGWDWTPLVRVGPLRFGPARHPPVRPGPSRRKAGLPTVCLLKRTER